LYNDLNICDAADFGPFSGMPLASDIAKDMAAKQPARKRRNLKTFTAPKVTVFKQKKEIKDNQTVISCLRKQIAFSKLTRKPVTDLDQFSTLP
jgi:hypothetical protein